jgi:hypothetical protein
VLVVHRVVESRKMTGRKVRKKTKLRMRKRTKTLTWMEEGQLRETKRTS